MLRLAVIGIGNMGFAHAKCIFSGEISGCVLCAVCDTDPGRLALAEKAFPGVASYADAAALFAAEKPDAVVIATPHPSHTQLAMQAMQRGIHVLSEKPADILYSRVQQACALAREHNVRYALMFNQRNHPVFRTLHRFLNSGMIGKIKRVSWTVTNWYRTQYYYDSGGWRGTWDGEGGGVLINQAPHNLDMICMLFGLPLAVYAQCSEGKYHAIQVEDEAILHLRYAEFTLVFTASTGECPGTNRMEIACDYGKVVVENGKIFWTRLSTSERSLCAEAQECFPEPQTETIEVTLSGTDTAHRGILQNFIDAIGGVVPLIADGNDGLREIMLSNAAYLSSWEGREIALPLQDDRFEEALRQRMENRQVKTAGQAREKAAGGYVDRWNVQW